MVLVACEESQAVAKAFRGLGVEAWSCDILPCSGGHSEWHLQCDVREILNDPKWTLVIAHPECTHLCRAGANQWKAKQADGRQQAAIDFFMMFARLDCRWCIENPVGIMSSVYRKPDQYVQPWMFGDRTTKKTGLWLHNLPKLEPTDIVDPEEGLFTYKDGRKDPLWHIRTFNMPAEDRRRLRSKTFEGLAKAMASQWGPLT